MYGVLEGLAVSVVLLGFAILAWFVPPWGLDRNFLVFWSLYAILCLGVAVFLVWAEKFKESKH